ncbi:MAG: beta-aspartyl-peptidase [Bacteroidales bacterium]|nr:beta-aspartyl-peptidase [Bacteroidales bacterium]
MVLKLLRNCEVYAPRYLGKKDILIAGEIIVAVGDDLGLPVGVDVEVIDIQNQTVVPGFIDAHVHVAGAGGEGGPTTRTPEMMLSDFIQGGVTTIVGCLGTDGLTRDLASVLMKVKALRLEGISAWMWVGAYQVPTPTFTGDVGKDIALIDEIIGVGEIAISDHRSSWPTIDELLRLTEHARVGGMLGGKAGLINIHLGDQEDPFRPLFQVIERSHNMLKLTQFLPTHCNRNDYTFESAIEYLKAGGYIDITTSSYPYFPEYEVKPSTCLSRIVKENLPLERVTFTSDAGGSLPGFDEQGNLVRLEVGKPEANLRELKDAVKEGVDLEKALLPLTFNPAQILKLPRKGIIQEGNDADLLILDKDFNLIHVFARGNWMMKNSQIIRKGAYEK